MALAVLTVLTGAQAQDVALPAPSEMIDPGSLSEGLAVSYFLKKRFEHVDDLAMRHPETGEPGPPLLVVDYRSLDGPVLTSSEVNAVGAHISGYIHLAKAGTYQFAMESNDGVRLLLNDEFILEDPEIHSDRFTEVVNVSVATPGWYPITIWYYEKKGTSTLRLLWLEPGAPAGASLDIVPGAALRHRKG